jgi:hypothetical protein
VGARSTAVASRSSASRRHIMCVGKAAAYSRAALEEKVAALLA